MVRARIVATGMSVPETVLTNHDLEKMVDTSDEWIKERTGMSERHIADEHTAASDLALLASRQALDTAGLHAEQLDAILVATITPDYPFPATACLLQDKLGAPHTLAFDLSAACTGFLYGLSVAQAYIESGRFKNVLLVGVDVLSKVVDWDDRNTCVLFGDGAGAAVLQPAETGGIYETILGSDGSSAELLYQKHGGSKHPINEKAVQEKSHCLYMNGRNIYKLAVKVMSQSCLDVLAKCGRDISEVKWVIPHQANIRIIEAVADRLKLSMEKVFVNVHKYANTSAATIPMALHEAVMEDKVMPGDMLLFVSFGGGLTWGATLLEY